MREPIRDIGRLQHILEAIDRVLQHVGEKKSLDDLHLDELQYFGIVKSIEIVGEASYKLTAEFKSAHVETPWRYIEKMRHILVHDYYQVSKMEVWKVIQDDLPILRQQVQQYLDELNKKEEL